MPSKISTTPSSRERGLSSSLPGNRVRAKGPTAGRIPTIDATIATEWGIGRRNAEDHTTEGLGERGALLLKTNLRRTLRGRGETAHIVTKMGGAETTPTIKAIALNRAEGAALNLRKTLANPASPAINNFIGILS